MLKEIKYALDFKKYYLRIWRSGRTCVPANTNPVVRTIYVRNKIKEYSKKYPDNEILLIVPSHIYFSIYSDLIYEGSLTNIIGKDSIGYIKEKNNLMIFSNGVPHCDILLKKNNLYEYFVFGLY